MPSASHDSARRSRPVWVPADFSLLNRNRRSRRLTPAVPWTSSKGTRDFAPRRFRGARSTSAGRPQVGTREHQSEQRPADAAKPPRRPSCERSIRWGRDSLFRAAEARRPRRGSNATATADLAQRGTPPAVSEARGAQARDDRRSGRAQFSSRLGNGGGGIRTLETLTGLPVFKTGTFNRSATPPDQGAAYRAARV